MKTPHFLIALGVLISSAPMPASSQSQPSAPVSGAARTVAVDSTKRALPPAEAYRRGFLALKDAGVDRFATDHPTWDGRGVLIAILDSGIDPSVAGLQTTTDGSPKILDLRDFSHEGHVALARVGRRGDTLIVGTRRLLGAATVAALSGAGPIWGGTIAELPLGAPPAADLDGSGSINDTLAVIVVRAPSGWVVFADTQEDGTLVNDRPVHDFAVARETFGWNRGGHPTPVSLAVNLSDSLGTPQLDLYFDTSSHGTHVSGIAAGHSLYGVIGFDGVAPGARIIGLKISNDAHGGITVTGAIVRALDYAIAFAAARRLPLVVNLSFGVGNEIEGTARIDAMVDSVLEAHPDVVMTVAAANDGPALSTAGFPGSASRVLSIGATEPRVFAGAAPSDSAPSPLASFSSRGGELAAPDIVVPGVAYSTVPNFAVGEEQESGTSMASPYAAGLVARLLSAATANGRKVSAITVAQALRASATSATGSAVVDAGAGTPDLSAAWKWLDAQRAVPQLAVDVGAIRGRGAVFIVNQAGAGRPAAAEAGVTVTFRRLDGKAPLTVRLRSTVSWIRIPATVALTEGLGRFQVTVDPVVWGTAGVQTGAIRVETPEETFGTLIVIPVTVVNPLPAAPRTVAESLALAGGGTGRVFVPADTGRGMQIEVATTNAGAQVMAMLHEPGGMPFRDGAGTPAGFGEGAGLFDISADDVERGAYEVDVLTTPSRGEKATVTVRRAPVRLSAAYRRDTLHALATNVISSPVSIRLRIGLIGAEQQIAVQRQDDAPFRVVVPVPTWATRVIVDSRMPREAWSRFTDFGVTVQDHSGRQVETSPLNYAFGRLGTEVPAIARGDSIVILLSPGFADAAGSQAWSLDLSVRFLLDKPYTLDEGGSPFRPLAADATRDERFPLSRMPIVIPAGLDPLVIVVALEGEDHIWTRQIRLPINAGMPK